MSSENPSSWSWFKGFWSHSDSGNSIASAPSETPSRSNLGRRLSRKVVPGLPRPGTFKRQQSELRDRLEPVKPDPVERRAVSADRRRASVPEHALLPQQSAPELLDHPPTDTVPSEKVPQETISTIDEIPHDEAFSEGLQQQTSPQQQPAPPLLALPTDGPPSINEGEIDEEILKELETCWILNLSMHFRDQSKREKFFVTYAEKQHLWRRVTISVDYRNAPESSLEWDLAKTRYQRDKSARIYEAIRESLPDIQFYPTVTNLKLETLSDRLHVHVTEDVHEIIRYPSITAVGHLSCRRVREDELHFDSHLSGFVYRVRVDGEVFIKKEIPGPNTVEEFLYEINALHTLSGSRSVIQFKGIVVDSTEKFVKGLLIAFAERGALVDVIYDEKSIPWRRREKWARQIIQGLSEIHEAGFVQGDFTLSNIVIDDNDNAKIIDINRRGCPFKWEPPEMNPLIQSGQRISMYIGVKSDLWQLGICLWALAMENDEPEAAERPFSLHDAPADVPTYYRELVQICLSENPRNRQEACILLQLFPEYVQSGSDRIPQTMLPDNRPINGTQYVDVPTISSRGSHWTIDDRVDKDEPELFHDPDRSATTYEGAQSEVSGSYSGYTSRGRSPAARPMFAGENDPYIINVAPPYGYMDSDTASATELFQSNYDPTVSLPAVVREPSATDVGEKHGIDGCEGAFEQHLDEKFVEGDFYHGIENTKSQYAISTAPTTAAREQDMLLDIGGIGGIDGIPFPGSGGSSARYGIDDFKIDDDFTIATTDAR